MTSDSIILSIIILAYLGVIGYFSLHGFRTTKSTKDYLVAGCSIHPFVMAMSYDAAFISTSSIVGFGGVAGQFGLGLLWLPFMNIAIGVFIAFIFFGRRTRKMGHSINAHTFPEFIGTRFDSKGLRISSSLIIFIFIPLYSGVVLIGGARFIEKIMGLNYNAALMIFAVIIALYVIIGGLKGVMYVDAFMGSIMVLGMIFLASVTYYKLGGIVEAHEKLTQMAPLVPAKLQALGHIGWTQMPELNSTWWWILVSSLMLGVGIGVLAQPQLAVRFMTVKSGKQLNRAVLIGSIFILLTAGVAYVVGALSNVWFYETQKQIAIKAAGGNCDLIIPLFIKTAMPKWFVYIFTITLLSAAMSTLSSLFHVTGTSIGHDFFCSVFKRHKDSMSITKAGIIFGIIVSVVLGYLLPPGIVARGTAIFLGVCAATFLPLYAAAIYWKRTTKSGVWASMLTGLGVSLFCLTFLHRKESAALGICKFLTGKTELISSHPWPYVDSIVISLPLSLLALVAVSLITKQFNYKHICKCFHEIGSIRKK
ncbi:MAG: sodium:solute symporter family protein [Lentisphaerae bacterium]|nr:sodium:solute symporter family protein [Lentisphaerota bacterium]MCP4100896.1 sodium:solute symporter family protein [Lentisphaerota bacterium]